MRARIMKIRRELEEFDKEEISTLMIKFLSEAQIIVISQMLNGGFDLNKFINEDINLEDIMKVEE